MHLNAEFEYSDATIFMHKYMKYVAILHRATSEAISLQAQKKNAEEKICVPIFWGSLSHEASPKRCLSNKMLSLLSASMAHAACPSQ